MKIVIPGGTGFIGQYLKDGFEKSGHQVFIIARSGNAISWNDQAKMIAALENADMLINLAGKSVNCRYNEKNKEAILKSRTETTRKLGEAILKCTQPPKLWINSSTATIYRHAEDRPMTESTGEIGTGFSVNVATSWEKEFFSFTLPSTRQIALRIAIVLGKGGAMTPLMNLVKFGLGGKQGSGQQKFSWLHIEDLYSIIHFLNERKDLSGVFNCSAPNPTDNQTFMKSLRKQMKMPFGLPASEWMLKIGTFLMQTETELVLKSRWVFPERLLQEGYQFKFSEVAQALKEIVDGDKK